MSIHSLMKFNEFDTNVIIKNWLNDKVKAKKEDGIRKRNTKVIIKGKNYNITKSFLFLFFIFIIIILCGRVRALHVKIVVIACVERV